MLCSIGSQIDGPCFLPTNFQELRVSWGGMLGWGRGGDPTSMFLACIDNKIPVVVLLPR